MTLARLFMHLVFKDGWDSRPYLFAIFAASREVFFTRTKPSG